MVAVGSAGVAALFLVRLEEEKRSVFATVTSSIAGANAGGGFRFPGKSQVVLRLQAAWLTLF